MWTEVRWEIPRSEKEFNILNDIITHLEYAYKADPNIDYPWKEWHEITGYIAECTNEEIPFAEEIKKRTAETEHAPTIGYRRQNLITILPGKWSIEIPGCFSEKYEKNGETWIAWDGPRTIRFSSLVCLNSDRSPIPAEKILTSESDEKKGEILEYNKNNLISRACIYQTKEEDHVYWMLQANLATRGNFAVCTIYFDHLEDREWAINTWHSIGHL
jgi:hypothetical protein